MMASTEAQIKDLKKRLQDQFGILSNKKSMRALGVFLIVDMQKRIRLGFGVKKQFGKKQSLKNMKPHSASYRAFRQRNSKQLHSTTRPNRQNLTFTGQLVFDLRLTKITKSNFVVGHSKAKRDDDNFSNRQLSDWVQDAGRVYMNVSDLEFKRMLRFYQNEIVKPTLSKI